MDPFDAGRTDKGVDPDRGADSATGSPTNSAGADVGTGTGDALGSPAYSAARRAERLERLASNAARGAPSLDAADSTDAATVTAPPTRMRSGALTRALSPAQARAPGNPLAPAVGPSGAAATAAATAASSLAQEPTTASVVSSRGPSPLQPGSPRGMSTPPATSRPKSPHTQQMAAMQGIMSLMIAQVQALTTAVAQGLQTTSVAASPPRSPQMSTAQDARARFGATNGITHVLHVSHASGDTSFTATPQVRDRKPTKLANTSNIPTAPAHTAGLKKWRRDFCRCLDANVSGIGPLVCPDLYGATAAEAFDRTAIACAVEAIRIATKGTNAAEVFDDIDDEDVDPTTLMELVLDYIAKHDADSSLVLERELESIAPTATGTRVEQIGQVYKDIKCMERRYKANGLVRGPDYFVTRARLLVAQHYPGMTFSSDRAFKTLATLFDEYHHRAADADELEQRAAAEGRTGGAFTVMGTEPYDGCHERASQDQSGAGKDDGDAMDYKTGYADVSAELADAEAALAAHQAERLAEMEAALTASQAGVAAKRAVIKESKAKQQNLQARVDASEALLAKYQAQGGHQHELPGGPP